MPVVSLFSLPRSPVLASHFCFEPEPPHVRARNDSQNDERFWASPESHGAPSYGSYSWNGNASGCWPTHNEMCQNRIYRHQPWKRGRQGNEREEKVEQVHAIKSKSAPPARPSISTIDEAGSSRERVKPRAKKSGLILCQVGFDSGHVHVTKGMSQRECACHGGNVTEGMCMSQRKCHRGNVTEEMLQRKCHRGNVTEEMSQRKCCRGNVTEKMSQRKCCRENVTEKMSQSKSTTVHV